VMSTTPFAECNFQLCPYLQSSKVICAIVWWWWWWWCCWVMQ